MQTRTKPNFATLPPELITKCGMQSVVQKLNPCVIKASQSRAAVIDDVIMKKTKDGQLAHLEDV